MTVISIYYMYLECKIGTGVIGRLELGFVCKDEVCRKD